MQREEVGLRDGQSCIRERGEKLITTENVDAALVVVGRSWRVLWRWRE